MKDLWYELKQTNKPVVLYGMGNGADKIIKILESKNIAISGIFASDGFVRNKTFHGFKIESYSELKAKFGDMVVLLCFGTTLPDVLDNIKRISSEQELYAPDVPVYGDTLFDGEYFENQKQEFEKIYSLLADSHSKKVFENTIKYKLSGKLDYLYECETSPDELYESFFKLTDNETYVDLGAYRGDTVADFLSRVNGYDEIYAAEPDTKTFSKLKTATENIDSIKLFNACIGEYDGKIPFAMNGSRGSNASKGITETECITLDSMLKSAVPTFIKMDIEGNELSAIKGGENIIKTFKPKMQISCYHRSEDLLTIPSEILKLRNDYKIYMRHFKSVPAWDTCYYFI